MKQSIVDTMYEQNAALVQYLENAGEISLSTAASEASRKALVLAAASYFEFVLRDIMIEYISERTSSDRSIMALVKSKAIDRQYHTYFEWDGKNANKFFSLFGDDFKNHMKKAVEKDGNLGDAIKNFLELGNLRNQLVHMNYASFALDNTLDEIYSLYISASAFLDCLPERLREDHRPVEVEGEIRKTADGVTAVEGVVGTEQRKSETS